MVSWGANAFKMVSEYDTLTSEMSIELFSKWRVDQLKGFLKRRGVSLSGRKAELAEKAYYAWKLKLEVAKTTQDEEDDISTTRSHVGILIYRMWSIRNNRLQNRRISDKQAPARNTRTGPKREAKNNQGLFCSSRASAFLLYIAFRPRKSACSEVYCVVCFGAKPLTLSVPLATQMYVKEMGTGKLTVENIPPMNFIYSGCSRNTLSCFMRGIRR